MCGCNPWQVVLALTWCLVRMMKELVELCLCAVTLLCCWSCACDWRVAVFGISRTGVSPLDCCLG